jgi:hypothetical protein
MPKMRRFRFYWIGGKYFEAEGYDVAHAFKMAGYSGGAVRALDYFKEIAEESKKPATNH